MKNVLVAAFAVLMGLMSSGCMAGLAFSSQGAPPFGLFVNTTLNNKVVENKLGKKEGQSCATSILGLVTTGDASVGTAAKSAGISTVSVVDFNFENILGIYAKYCVVVRGN